MQYWSALGVLQQVSAELGLPRPETLVATTDVQTNQLLALLNSAGNELITYYTWEQFIKQWVWTTVPGQDAYDIPEDWLYFTDQTQWDRTNHWPLLGPKSPQEWAWLKGGLGTLAPRTRYRVYQEKFFLHPVPAGTPVNIAMEYVTKNWVLRSDNSLSELVVADGDKVLFHPWLIMKLLRVKFYDLKGFDSTAAGADFLRILQSMTGKSKGAPILSLSPSFPPLFVGPWSIPDGSWDTSGIGL